MKRLNARSAFVAIVVAFTAVAPAQDSRPSIAGRWTITYWDRAAGLVTGGAKISEDQSSAEVWLKDAGGGTKRLRSSKVEPTEGGVRIVIEGDSPSVAGFRWQPPAEPIDVPAGRVDLELRLGRSTRTIPITAPKPADDDRVTLELGFAGERALAGTWKQFVRADTGRGENGRGRVGDFSFTDDGSGRGVMTGIETWSRPHARVHLVVVVQDQMSRAADDAAWGYPWDEQGRETGTALIDRQRTLLVLGEDLPAERGDPVELSSFDPLLEYRVRALREDFEKEDYSEDLRRAWSKIESALPDADVRRLRRLESMLVTARMEQGVLPGRKGFTVDGAEGVWYLEFGDFTGELAVARPHDDPVTSTTPTQSVFVPGRVVFEIEADRALPFEEIPLVVCRSGKALVFDGEREVMARRVAGRPKTYRTEVFRVVKGSGTASGRTIPCNPGGVLSVAPAEPTWVHFRPPEAGANLLADPKDVGVTLHGGTATSLDWNGAVALAAKIAGKPVTGDLASLTAEDAERFTAFLAFKWSLKREDHEQEVDVTIGQHAAMLMLRQELVERLEQKARQLGGLGADPAVLRGFRKAFEPHAVRTHHPLADVQVTLPNGDRVRFAETFMPAHLEAACGLTGAERDAWVLEATKEALAAHVPKLREALKHAEGIQPGDVRGLLGLTATGFDGIRAACAQRMVRRRAGGTGDEGAWEDDLSARTALGGLDKIAEALRAQDGAQSTDRFLVLGVGGAFVSAGAWWLGGLGYSLFALATDVADLAYTVYFESESQWAEVQELSFAEGALALLGVERFEEALERDRDWYFSAFAIGLSAGSMTMGAFATQAKWSEMKAAERGRAILSSAPRGPGPGAGGAAVADEATRGRVREFVGGLGREQRRDVVAAILEARRLERRMGRAALEASEQTAADFARALDDTLRLDRARKPLWADRLDDELFARIAPLLGKKGARRDIPELFMADPVRMGRLVKDDDALALLELNGFRNVDELEKAVKQLRERPVAREKLGGPNEKHYRAAFRKEPDPKGFTVFGDVASKRPRKGGGDEVHLDAQFGADTRDLAEVELGRVPAGRTREPGEPASPGDMVVFNAAVDFRRPNQWELSESAEYNPIESLRAPQGMARPPPKFVRTAVDMVAGKGTPFMIWFTLRNLQNLGVKFGDAAVSLVKLETVLNTETLIHFEWLRRLYPDAPLGKLFRATAVSRYAETVLAKRTARRSKAGSPPQRGNPRVRRIRRCRGSLPS